MPHFPLGLTMGMMLSIPMVIAGIALFLYSRRASALAPPAPPQTTADAKADEPRATA
jgi:prolipoprotein diacylglyceryltransferase